jgi:hypothetical protein
MKRKQVVINGSSGTERSFTLSEQAEGTLASEQPREKAVLS